MRARTNTSNRPLRLRISASVPLPVEEGRAQSGNHMRGSIYDNVACQGYRPAIPSFSGSGAVKQQHGRSREHDGLSRAPTAQRLQSGYSFSPRGFTLQELNDTGNSSTNALDQHGDGHRFHLPVISVTGTTSTGDSNIRLSDVEALTDMSVRLCGTGIPAGTAITAVGTI